MRRRKYVICMPNKQGKSTGIQQKLRERASMLRYAYIASLVWKLQKQY